MPWIVLVAVLGEPAMKSRLCDLLCTRLAASVLLAAVAFPSSDSFAGDEKKPKGGRPAVRLSAGVVNRKFKEAIDIAVSNGVITREQGEQAQSNPELLVVLVRMRTNGDLLGLSIETIRKIQEAYAQAPDEEGRRLANRRLVAAGVQVNYGISLPGNAFDATDPTQIFDAIQQLQAVGLDPKEVGAVLADPSFYEKARQVGPQQALLSAVRANDPMNPIFDSKNGAWEERGGRFVRQVRELASNDPGSAQGGASAKTPGAVPGFGSHSGKGSGRSGGRRGGTGNGSSGSTGSSSSGGGTGGGNGGAGSSDNDDPSNGPAPGDYAGKGETAGSGTGAAGTGPGNGEATPGASNGGGQGEAPAGEGSDGNGQGGAPTGGGTQSDSTGSSSGSQSGTDAGSGTSAGAGTSSGSSSSKKPPSGSKKNPPAETGGAPSSSPHGGRRWVKDDKENNSDGTVTIIAYFDDGSYDAKTYNAKGEVIAHQTSGNSVGSSDDFTVETSSDPENYVSPGTAALLAATMAELRAYLARGGSSAGSEINPCPDANPDRLYHGKGRPPQRLRGLLVGGDRRGDRETRGAVGDLTGQAQGKDEGTVDPVDPNQR